VDNQTGTILDAKNKNAKVQIASLTKIATALVTLDWADLKKRIWQRLWRFPRTQQQMER
jgi:D-alanyl-D-alanine carboxypeptidase